MKYPLPPLNPKDLPPEARLAIKAANRSAKILRETKRKLGHKLVIVENGQIKIVAP